MPSTGTIPLINVIPGQTITASLWLNEYENIDTLFTPAGLDDYSGTDTEMRTTTDPYPASATSRPTSTQGELERIRYVIAQLSGETYWYIDPQVSIATFKTRFDAHTHDGTANNGPQILAAGIASLAVTDAKINDVAATKITGTISTAQIAALAVTDAKINDVAATKITGTVSTAQIANSAVTAAKILDATITPAKLDSTVPAAVGMKSIQNLTVSPTVTNGAATSTTNTTITSVNTAKSVAIVTSITQSSGTAQACRYTVSISSATNLATTLILPNASVGSSAFSVSVTVLEFN